MEIELTREQCAELADFIDIWLFTTIRDNDEADSMEWVSLMVDAWKKFKKAVEGIEQIEPNAN